MIEVVWNVVLNPATGQQRAVCGGLQGNVDESRRTDSVSDFRDEFLA